MIKISTRNQPSNHLIAKIAIFVIFLSVTLVGSDVNAQVTYTESFDVAGPYPQQNLPNGWSQGKFGAGADPDNYWDRMGAGAFVGGFGATVNPRTGSGMARYLSYYTATGEMSFLASKILDNRGKVIGATPDTVKLWMWRDNLSGYLTNVDRIRVYVNDSATLGTDAGGATLLTETVNTTTEINRSCSLTPVPVTCNGWNEYKWAIPTVAPYAGGGADSVYIIILGISDDGNNIFLDDFSVTTVPNSQAYVANSAGVIYQNTATTAPSQTNQVIIGCKLNMGGSALPRVLTNIEFNTNGSTNPPTDISAAKLYFTGGTNTFNIASAILLGTYTNPWATNYMFLTAPNANYSGMASFSGLEHGENYFWILYDLPVGAVAGNFVDAEWLGGVISGTPIPSINPATVVGSRLIDVVYCIGAYSAGTSWASYNNNDYIRNVSVTGGVAPDISNNKNWITASCAGNMTDGCATGPFPKDCPFQKHGPDYELFAETGHPGYTIGRSTTKNFTADGTTPYFISYQCGTWFGANYIAAWIDYNHDGDFYDAGEKIAQSPSMAALTTWAAPAFTIPTTAVAGKTRLRVREVYADSNIDPCNFRTWGETEDYVITIIPDCPGYPGYTTWLGLSDDWSDPDNWCPAVAPIFPNPYVNVRLPGLPAGAYTYVRPVIKSGVVARANKLRIEANDTLYINAPSASSLTVQDSVKIWTPSSAFKINTTYLDTVQLLNGTLNRTVETPLYNLNRVRSFLAFSPADLVAQGLQSGDVVTNILMHIQRKSNGNPYKNFTVKYFYTTPAQALFGTLATANIPLPTGAPAAPVTLFSADLDVDAFVPALNGYGTVDLVLPTTFAWNGNMTNFLIIEICYDNIGFAGTGAYDDIKFTQTTGFRRYMSLRSGVSVADYAAAGCALSPKDTVVVSASWVNATTAVTLTGTLAQIASVKPGQVSYSGGVNGTVLSILGNVVTMSNASTGTSSGNITFANAENKSGFYRPNLTFKTSRPYIKYPISVAGHWENNGTFVPAVSRVTMNGSTANQKIDGTVSTTFYDLDIFNINHVMRYRDFTVTDSLKLVSGRLKLNNGMVTLTNPATSALTRTAGYIQAETDVLVSNAFPYGRLRWQMGSVPGLRVIPFVNTAGVSIPLDYSIDSGTHDVIIGTFNTLPDNTNLPLPEVTNVFGFNGSAWNADGSAVVDRYFLVKDTAGVTPQADIMFRWASTERAANNPTAVAPMSGQRWINPTDLWEFPFIPGQLYSAGVDQLNVQNYLYDGTATWWNIVGNTTPLPVTLLDFTAEQHKDRVKLKWTTASELNNSHFEIERTVDNDAFEFIGRAESKGPGNNMQEYYTWDNNPLQGIQYYYLRQYDYDGRMESFGPVSANFSKDEFDILTTSVSPTDMGLTVVFNYNSNEPVSYRIMDMTGRIIVAKDRFTAVEGLNVIEIDAKLAKGAYHIILQNNSKMVSRKFFY